MKVGDLVRYEFGDGVFGVGLIIDQSFHSFGTEFCVLVVDDNINQYCNLPQVDRFWFMQHELELIETNT